MGSNGLVDAPEGYPRRRSVVVHDRWGRGAPRRDRTHGRQLGRRRSAPAPRHRRRPPTVPVSGRARVPGWAATPPRRSAARTGQRVACRRWSELTEDPTAGASEAL